MTQLIVLGSNRGQGAQTDNKVLDEPNIIILFTDDRSYDDASAYVPTNVPYVKGYLNHGKAPKNAGYEYEVLLNTPKEMVKGYVGTKSYEVWQKDNDLHGIYHLGTGTEAYAIFTENKVIANGQVLTSDTPVLAMLKKSGDYSVLTVSDPDLRLKKWNHNMSRMPMDITNGASEGHVATITLRGEWYLAGSVNEVLSVNPVQGNTIIKVLCKYGNSIDIPLETRTTTK